MAIVFPITAFVASGIEHSVANMYSVPLAIILKGQAAVVSATETMAGKQLDMSNLTTLGFTVKNLIPVTLGNIIGGGFLVGLVYWSVYVRKFTWTSLLRLQRVNKNNRGKSE